MLIQKISASLTSTGSFSSTFKSIVNRCYRTLKLPPRLAACDIFQTVYLNLFLKSVKADAGVGGGKRVKTLIRRFLQIFKVSGGGTVEVLLNL